MSKREVVSRSALLVTGQRRPHAMCTGCEVSARTFRVRAFARSLDVVVRGLVRDAAGAEGEALQALLREARQLARSKLGMAGNAATHKTACTEEMSQQAREGGE